MDKATVLRNMHGVYDAWWSAVARIPIEHMDDPNESPWTAKDEIAHVSFYDRRFAGHILALARGDEIRHAETYDHPQPMHEFTTLDEFNENIRLRYCAMSPAEVVAGARCAFDALVRAIEDLPDEHWDRPAPFSGERTLVQIMPFNTWVHYAKHMPPLEMIILKR